MPPMPEPSSGSGRVVQINVSAGGVPKEPVAEATVRTLGLDGDRHRADTVHGGPLRAVCLMAIEAIDRVRAEGHPIFPGSVGENLTTVGLELSDLPAGTRLAIGEVLLEVTTPAMPCDTIVRSFSDGKSGRISILLHPHDARMYARVLREGVVRAGDQITVLAPDPASDIATQVALFRLESVERHAHLALWRAAADAGCRIDVVDDGELAVGSSPDLAGPIFNRAFGLRPLPMYLPLVLERFGRTRAAGWFTFDSPPWPGAVAERLALLTAEPGAVERFDVDRVETGEARPHQIGSWADGPQPGGPWATVFRRLATARTSYPFVSTEGGRVVGRALLITHRKVGYLAAGSVAAPARGRGIQRALIAARARRAIELGCDLLAVEVAEDNVASLRNVERSGFRVAAWRDLYRFDPAHSSAAASLAHSRASVGRWEPSKLPGSSVGARPG